jgi:superfamily II DNA or RNA helicase
MVTLRFNSGTIELSSAGELALALPAAYRWDPRSACHRAPANAYPETIRQLVKAKMSYEDQARAYVALPAGLQIEREARPYQAEALAAWEAQDGRGVVVLPTGSGKSHVALMAIDRKRRASLVVAPTLDLVRQWYDLLRHSFGQEVGVIGGGEYSVQPLTVTTYDSAHLHMEHLGARFGLLICDEVHHLPGESYAWAAEACLAPYRLGLTATPERSDGRETRLDELLGKIVYRRDIVDFTGRYLAEYQTVRIRIHLSREEREAYLAARTIYREFVRKHGIRLGSPGGWDTFIMRAAQSAEGVQALAAHRRQRQLAFAAKAKLCCVEDLLHEHRTDRAILFTDDNATAYEISRRFLLPVITHQTKVRERSEILEGLSSGAYSAVVTSRVLNEGVDIPAANVAVVVSGSGSVREHVQRLGRILRPKDGKRATLYELITVDTSETYTSEQRRDHVAYR